MNDVSTILLYEILGTATLLLLGCGVVANVALAGSKGEGGGFLLVNFGWGIGVFAGVYVAYKSGAHLNPVNFGWGIGVFAGVYVAYKSGAHLNPAVTVGLLASGADEYAPDIAVNVVNTLTYFAAELIGAFLGAVLAWLAYRQHFDATEDPAAKLGVFSTGPAIRNPVWNTLTEVIGTFVLVYWILQSGNTPTETGPLAVALVVVGIGASLGGPTGYAINPARDLGPRIAHALLPIRGKGGSDWGYSWVPVVGPLIGAVIAGLASAAVG